MKFWCQQRLAMFRKCIGYPFLVPLRNIVGIFSAFKFTRIAMMVAYRHIVFSKDNEHIDFINHIFLQGHSIFSENVLKAITRSQRWSEDDVIVSCRPGCLQLWKKQSHQNWFFYLSDHGDCFVGSWTWDWVRPLERKEIARPPTYLIKWTYRIQLCPCTMKARENLAVLFILMMTKQQF